MDYFVYRGVKTSQISFPLGGIGTGSRAGGQRPADRLEITTGPTKAASTAFPILPSGRKPTAKCWMPVLWRFAGALSGGNDRHTLCLVWVGAAA